MDKKLRDRKILEIQQESDGMQTTYQIGLKCYNEGYAQAHEDIVKLLTKLNERKSK